MFLDFRTKYFTSYFYIFHVSGIVLDPSKSEQLYWPIPHQQIANFERTSQDSSLEHLHSPVAGTWLTLFSSGLMSAPGRWMWCLGWGAVWGCDRWTVSVSKVLVFPCLVLDKCLCWVVRWCVSLHVRPSTKSMRTNDKARMRRGYMRRQC